MPNITTSGIMGFYGFEENCLFVVAMMTEFRVAVSFEYQPVSSGSRCFF